MTIAEIENRLPAGLHDAKLLKIVIDYEKLEAEIEFKVWIPTEQHAEKYARAILTLSGLQYLIIEPPGVDVQTNMGEHDLTSVDGFVTASFRGISANVPQPIVGNFAHSLFAYNWNSSIHIAASSAKLDPETLLDHSEAANEI